MLLNNNYAKKEAEEHTIEELNSRLRETVEEYDRLIDREKKRAKYRYMIHGSIMSICACLDSDGGGIFDFLADKGITSFALYAEDELGAELLEYTLNAGIHVKTSISDIDRVFDPPRELSYNIGLSPMNRLARFRTERRRLSRHRRIKS